MARDPFGALAEDSTTIDPIPEAELEACRRGDRGFGDMVRQLRADQELTMGALATSCGVGVVLISNVELGRERASAELVRSIAHALGVPFSRLLDVWDREAPGTADRMTVAEAQAMVRRLRGTGVECPCCGGLVKERRRTLTPPMVRFLQWLVGEHRGEPLLIRDWIAATGQHGGDYAKIEHWGLARRAPGKEPRWSPTMKGVKLVRGQVQVHKVAILFRNEVVGWDGPLLSIDQLAAEPAERPERGEDRAPTLPGME